MPSKPRINRARRGPYDEMWTPEWVIDAIDEWLDPWKGIRVLWEAAPGSGQMSASLKRRGHRVVVEDRDFFSWEPAKWDILVTNPPFSKKVEWLDRCENLGKPWAVLLPVESLGVAGVQRNLDGAEVIFLPRRVDFTGKGRPWHAVAWYTKGLHIGKQLVFSETD